MTTAFQASIKYPLIWIINTANPSESEPSINKAHKKLKKMVRFTDWLCGHYETAYHYYLTQHLHEYGIGIGEIQDFLGLRVTGAKTLHISLYRKSWSEVYVDVIVRAYVDIFTGDEYAPQCGHSYTDYRVRGYYDLYEKRCHLFQYFMPYRHEDDMDKLRLDDYLVPIIGKNDLEDTAHWFLEEHYPDGLLNPSRINIKSMIREMGLHVYRTGLSEDERINGVLYLKGKRVTLYTDDGTPFFANVPDKTILLERKLCRDNPRKADNTAFHECTHFGLHSLFFLFQTTYIEELHQYFDPIDEEKLLLDEEGRKEIALMEWQAKRLAPRIQMHDEWVDEKMQELLSKYAWMNEYAMYEKIINDLAEYFHVSKETAKYRLKELGYSDTRGLLNYINEAYIPAYKIPSEISPYQTFDISKDELVKMFRTDGILRANELIDNLKLAKDACTFAAIRSCEPIAPHLYYESFQIGNGRMFVDFFRSIILMNDTRGRWYIYDGRVWRPDQHDIKIAEMAKDFRDALLSFAPTITAEDTRNRFLSRVDKLDQRKYRDLMVKDAGSDPAVTVDMSAFDRDKFLFNCHNGTINLLTGEFKPHDPADMLTKMTEVDYVPDAVCDRWLTFMDEVMEGDKERIKYLQKAIGYAMSGDTRLEA